MDRREMLQILATVPLAHAFGIPAGALERAAAQAAQAAQDPASFIAQFFTPHELRTVTVLADLVIPRDERSGSASDAGVPAFIDFMMIDRPQMQASIRDGLTWLDAETRRRFDRAFIDATAAQQAAILDDIAWPARAPEPMQAGVAFFNRFRDLVASGFWSSKIGVEDLRYMGNTVVPQWNGCPDEALQHLGVTYAD